MSLKSAPLSSHPSERDRHEGFTPVARTEGADSEMSPMLYVLMVPIGGYVFVATKMWKLVDRVRTLRKAPRR